MLQHNKRTVRWTVFFYLRNVVISEYRSKRGDALFWGASTCAHCGAVDKPYPIFKLRDKIEEKTGWDGYADTDRR